MTHYQRMASGGRNSRSSGSSIGRSRRAPVRGATSYVLCVKNDGYPASLDLGKLYRCLRDLGAERHSMRRVFDESGEDYLYPRDWFIEHRTSPAAGRQTGPVVDRR